MLKRCFSISVWLVLCGVAVSAAEHESGSSAKAPKHFKEIGGSNYVMYDVGREYLETGDLKAWFSPGVMQPVVATFHQQKKEKVQEQLNSMRVSGQRKISIMMWHDRLTPEQLRTGGVHGHVLASNGGALLPQHEENLKGLLELIRQNGGFNELVFRFAAQGAVSPDHWKQWSEDQYGENFNFIVSVRQLVRDALQGSGMKLTFDLGAELGGIESGSAAEYTGRMWQDYTRRFGAEDTFGFSIAVHPGRVALWIQACDKTGIRPACFALDLYDHIPAWMDRMVSEFRSAGISDPQIIVLETYFNDPQILKELQGAAERNHIEYLYLMQWPLKRGSAVAHFSSEAFNGDSRYEAYFINKGN